MFPYRGGFPLKLLSSCAASASSSPVTPVSRHMSSVCSFFLSIFHQYKSPVSSFIRSQYRDLMSSALLIWSLSQSYPPTSTSTSSPPLLLVAPQAIDEGHHIHTSVCIYISIQTHINMSSLVFLLSIQLTVSEEESETLMTTFG